MDADSYGRVRALFDALFELDAPAREQALQASDATPEVQARVRSMLGAAGATTGLVTPMTLLIGTLAEAPPEPGETLGAWTLVRKIGEGGMGAVWAARRSDGHFEQDAAIKLLRGLPSAAALAFLASERQILASLTHPNIARLLDGGTTPGGQPYLVMEYLDGEPIDHHCRVQRPGPAALLRLLLPICDALSYAHARLVVHCDIKPGNILVRADGRPCLLDFGIARLLGDSAGAVPTAPKARAYTPGFGSPEQEAGGALTTASDVYGLGRLLSRLLRDAGCVVDRELRAISERATLADPALRYPSVAAFAQDLRNYLERRPLQALQRTPSYRARLWLQRRWPLALAGAIFAVTVVGFTWQLARDRDRARAAEATALAERDHAAAAELASRRISDFLVSMLDGVNPDAGGNEVPVSQLVQQALARIDSELAGQPSVQSELYATLANVQTVLRTPDAAQLSLEKAIAIERTLDRPLVLADLLARLAGHLRANRSATVAAAPAREALALYRRQDVATPPATLAQAKVALGAILAYTTHNSEGLELLRAGVAAEAAIDARSAGHADALLTLGDALAQHGQLVEAERAMRQSLVLRRSGKDEIATVNAQETLGRLLVTMRQLPEAESLLREALAQRRALHGAEDVNISWRLSELGRVLEEDGRALQALPLYAEATESAGRKWGTDSVHYAVLLQNQARGQFRSGDLTTAERNFRSAYQSVSVHWNEQQSGLATVRTNFATLLVAIGAFDEAIELLVRAEAARAAREPVNATELAGARLLLAEAELRSGRVDAAARWVATVAGVELDPRSTTFAERLRVHALLSAARGDTEAALAELEKAEAAWTTAVSAGDPRAPLAKLDRAELLARSTGTRAQGAALARAIQVELEGKVVEDSPWFARLKKIQAG